MPAQNLLLAFSGWTQPQGRAPLWRGHQSALESKDPTSASRAWHLPSSTRQVRRQQEGLRIDLRVNFQARGGFSGHVHQGGSGHNLA